MSEENQDLERLRKAAEVLGEHFDSVQIFATRHESGTENGTINATWGTGNWFTRYGHVRDWVTKTEERTRKEVQKEE